MKSGESDIYSILEYILLAQTKQLDNKYLWFQEARKP